MRKIFTALAVILSPLAFASLLLLTPPTPSNPFTNTQSVNFNSATPSFADCGSLGQYQLADKYTMAGWVNQADDSTTHWWIGNQDDAHNSNGFVLGWSGTTLIMNIIPTSLSSYVFVNYANANWSTGAWHHFAFVADGGGMAASYHLYIDTLLSTPTTVLDTASGPVTYSVDTFLGQNGNSLPPHGYFTGNLNQVSFYTGPSGNLNQAAVTALYNSGTPKDQTGLTGLTNWFRMVGPADSTGTLTDVINAVTCTGSGLTFQNNVP
jgi:hypothetical protein